MYNFIKGLIIILSFCGISTGITHFLNLKIPASIIGLALFTLCLIFGIIKEESVKDVCEFFIKNMAMCIVPFVGGIVAYQKLVFQNIFVIAIVVLFATTISIILTGIFTEYGLKLMRLKRMKRNND